MSLESWGIYHQGTNPVARSNVCPEIGAPEAPGFHAFSYTVPVDTKAKSFVIAGSGEVPEGKDNYFDHVVRRGDQSPEALAEKARFVLAEMERRFAMPNGPRFSASVWRFKGTTVIQTYEVEFMGADGRWRASLGMDLYEIGGGLITRKDAYWKMIP